MSILTRYGKFVSHGSSDLIGKSLELYGEWAQNEIDFISQFIRSGDVVLDVGSHIGVHSRAFSELVGKNGVVHAFEPNPTTQRFLINNIDLASLNNINPHLYGASRGNRSFAYAAETLNNSGNFHIVSGDITDSNEAKISIPIKSVDALGFDSVNFIKIDVEGHEIEVLKGSLATIAKNRPVIFCEANSFENAVSILDLASSISYEAFHVRSRAYNQQNFNENQENFFDDAVEDNILLVPVERSVASKIECSPEKVTLTALRSPADISTLYNDVGERGADPALGMMASSCHADARRHIFLAVSFYNTPELVPFIIEGLSDLSKELCQNKVTVLLFNDSPDNQAMNVEFERAKDIVDPEINYEFIKNDANLGFVQTMNLAFDRARSEGADLLLLNSDAMLSAGALTEIIEVGEADPMIGFVCPRSNNATLATIGCPQIARSSDEKARRRLEQQLKATLRFLPRYQYAPTAVGFCLYVKHKILAEFGNFSLDYGKGYNEENDYVMRAGQVGFRAAIANWAYAFHEGEQSFQNTLSSKEKIELANAGILRNRYPEYEKLIGSYFSSENIKAESFLSTLAATRVRFAIDASALFDGHNGTVFLITTLVRSISEIFGRILDISVIADARAGKFHSLGSLVGVRVVPLESAETFDVILRIGQPFQISEIIRNTNHAPVNVYFMLDTIAIDCAQLYSRDLEEIWQFVMSNADGIVYNSNFTRDQFNRRFQIDKRKTSELVSYHSLDINEYKQKFDRDNRVEPYVLIVGNHFPHKNVMPTYDYLREIVPDRRYIVIGGESPKESDRKSDEFYKSGEMSTRVVDELYTNADVVVFPSFYEGFGLPIECALAAKKPVFVRVNSLNCEIAAKLNSKNLHFFETLGHLGIALKDNCQWVEDEALVAPHNWSDSATEIVEFCLQKLNSTSVSNVATRFREVGILASRNLSSDGRTPAYDNSSKNAVYDIEEREILIKSLSMFWRSVGIKRSIFFFWSSKRRRYKKLRKKAYRLITYFSGGNV